MNYSMCFDDGIIKVHKPKIKELLCGKEVIKSFLRSNVLCNNTIDKLFRSSIVKEIMFPTGYAIGEDMYVVFYMQNHPRQLHHLPLVREEIHTFLKAVL